MGGENISGGGGGNDFKTKYTPLFTLQGVRKATAPVVRPNREWRHKIYLKHCASPFLLPYLTFPIFPDFFFFEAQFLCYYPRFLYFLSCNLFYMYFN